MKNFVEIVKEYDYYDTHTHINSKPLLDIAEQIIEDCKNQKILINAIGTGAEDSLVGFKQAQKYINVFCTVGFHPEEIKNHTPEECKNLIDEILKLNDGSIIAIGEVGLDYTYDLDKNIQKQVFIKMIELAKKYHLPLELHIRDAHEDAITILNEHAKGITKIVHCFSASAEIASKYLDIGCYIAVNGILTFNKKIDDLLEAIQVIPINRLLIETDCPYLAPVPFRGKQNIPQYVKYVFDKVRGLYRITAEQLINQLRSNAIDIFGQKDK